MFLTWGRGPIAPDETSHKEPNFSFSLIPFDQCPNILHSVPRKTPIPLTFLFWCVCEKLYMIHSCLI